MQSSSEFPFGLPYRNAVAGFVGLALALAPRSGAWSRLLPAVGFLVGFLGVSYYAYLYGGSDFKPAARPWVPPIFGLGEAPAVIEQGSAFVVTQQGYAAAALDTDRLRAEVREGALAAAVIAVGSLFLL